MGVSKNNGTPKSSILIGVSLINHPFWGTPIVGNIHIVLYIVYHSKLKFEDIPSVKSTSFLCISRFLGFYTVPLTWNCRNTIQALVRDGHKAGVPVTRSPSSESKGRTPCHVSPESHGGTGSVSYAFLPLMAEILHQLRLVVDPIIYRVSYIPGGARFQPSTVLGPFATFQG